MEARIPQTHHVVNTNAGQHDGVHSLWLLLKSGEEAAESSGKNPERILHNASSSTESVVEDPFSVCKLPTGIRLHQPLAQGKGLIPNQEITDRVVVTWKFFIWW